MVKKILRNVYYGIKRRRATNKSFRVDLKRLYKYFLAFQNVFLNKDSLRCKIMLLNHQLEKAQTYSKAKEGYGKDKIVELIRLLQFYKDHYDIDDVYLTSLGVLQSHIKNPHSHKTDKIISEAEELINENKNNERGGILLYNSKNIPLIKDFESFLKSRRSCRKYSQEKISEKEIKEAVRLAQTSPSACNRQPVRIHYYTDKEIIKQLIISQRADIDWCLDATALIIVTTNSYYFRDYLERHQNMFDAGLFCMNLNLILHHKGIGSCFKMAQKDPGIENNTKTIGNIPAYEDICVLYCIGKYPEEPFAVAKSERLDLTNVLTVH